MNLDFQIREYSEWRANKKANAIQELKRLIKQVTTST